MSTPERRISKPPKSARRPLSPREEANFQRWYRVWADSAGLDPDPDNPLHKYDYRGAFLAGAKPEIDPGDGLYHWPSEFKADDHPNRFVDGVDTKQSGVRRRSLKDQIAEKMEEINAKFIPPRGSRNNPIQGRPIYASPPKRGSR
jgi:hypothetical protein